MKLFTDVSRALLKSKPWLAITFCCVVLLLSTGGHAAHSTGPEDLALPVDDSEVVERGSALFSEKCSACHGGEGRGGRAPCLSCGKFLRSGNSNAGIYSTIVMGVPMTKMGGFGSTVSAEDILSLVTYLRWKENERVRSGEITRPSAGVEQQLVFPE
jgi:mono/diheme cytochrome c family protein